MSVNETGEPTRLPSPLPASPLPLVARWFEEARADGCFKNPEAMALATCDAAGHPHVRMVICRRFDAALGAFSFYTSRKSPKGEQLDASGRASAVFYWEELGRQLRIWGSVARTSDADSDADFAGRHPLSRVSAWASDQSHPIESRAELERRQEVFARRFGAPEGSEPVPRPPHWGGYEITADRIELWVEDASRLHERAAYSRGPGSPPEARWHAERLQP